MNRYNSLFCLSRKGLTSSFFDAGFFAGKSAQVVQFCTTYFTAFVYDDFFDERRFDGEDSLNTDVAGHFTNRETFFVTVTRDTDYVSAELLDTFFVTFFDTVRNGNRITATESGMLFTGCEGFFCNL